MSRWSQYDEDDARLPEGMQRVGYDADTGRYYFRDGGGSTWQSSEGARYGRLTRVSNGPAQEDLEAAPTRADGYQPLATDNNRPLAFRNQVNTNSYRTLFPFFLLIGVFLLVVWKYMITYGYSAPQDPCPSNATFPYMVEPGDYCWTIATTHNCTLEELEQLNPTVDCNTLRPGAVVCLPQPLSLPTSLPPI
ncbi:carbohydrate-binding module family 50 protein [Collybiopsis luxurians FD-317 M1]|nr:carbohydrate-binding module family 50 protein [Collybiopsis luxurians FD-317 M1]